MGGHRDPPLLNEEDGLATNDERRTTNGIYPPCQANCPVNTDVRAYIAAINRGDNADSYRHITDRNYFPSVCGRICPHPCENDCRRKCVDNAISIARLKRYAGDDINKQGLFPGEPVDKTSGKKVAVIGSGPAGLTAAADLAREGHEVVVFEKDEKPGGMLAYGVPNFRLDFETLNQDIARILNQGIELHTNVEIGRDHKFQEVVDEFDAVIISIGLSVSRSLPIPGTQSRDVLKTLEFLKAANSGKPIEIGKRVVVVGGGDVAMDAARTAMRTGASEVTVCCLECSDEMPAHEWEIEEALEEGVKIYPSYGPKAIQTKDGRVKSFEFIACTSVFDKKGAFCPQFDESDKKIIKADTVILAIGQAANLSFLIDTDVEVNVRGQLVTDRATFQTSNPKVFGCGEVAKGPGAAIDAIAHAHKAAKSVNKYLNGEEAGFAPGVQFEKLGELPTKVARQVIKQARQLPKMRDANERVNDFDIFEETLDSKEALKEAHRCLSCTVGAYVDAEKCAACLTCVRVCPYDVPVFKDNVAFIDTLGCQACGFCAADCPAEAITMKKLSSEELNEKIKKIVKNKETLVINCEYAFYGAKQKTKAKEANLMVPCAGRIDLINMLKAFENGVKKLVINCDDETCRHKEGQKYVRRRAEYVNEKLKQIGFETDGVQVKGKEHD